MGQLWLFEVCLILHIAFAAAQMYPYNFYALQAGSWRQMECSTTHYELERVTEFDLSVSPESDVQCTCLLYSATWGELTRVKLERWESVWAELRVYTFTDWQMREAGALRMRLMPGTVTVFRNDGNSDNWNWYRSIKVTSASEFTLRCSTNSSLSYTSPAPSNTTAPTTGQTTSTTTRSTTTPRPTTTTTTTTTSTSRPTTTTTTTTTSTSRPTTTQQITSSSVTTVTNIQSASPTSSLSPSITPSSPSPSQPTPTISQSPKPSNTSGNEPSEVEKQEDGEGLDSDEFRWVGIWVAVGIGALILFVAAIAFSIVCSRRRRCGSEGGDGASGGGKDRSALTRHMEEQQLDTSGSDYELSHSKQRASTDGYDNPVARPSNEIEGYETIEEVDENGTNEYSNHGGTTQRISKQTADELCPPSPAMHRSSFHESPTSQRSNDVTNASNMAAVSQFPVPDRSPRISMNPRHTDEQADAEAYTSSSASPSLTGKAEHGRASDEEQPSEHESSCSDTHDDGRSLHEEDIEFVGKRGAFRKVKKHHKRSTILRGGSGGGSGVTSSGDNRSDSETESARDFTREHTHDDDDEELDFPREHARDDDDFTQHREDDHAHDFSGDQGENHSYTNPEDGERENARSDKVDFASLHRMLERTLSNGNGRHNDNE